VGHYFLQKDVLCRRFVNSQHPPAIMVPTSLVPFVLANIHFSTHGGQKKMLASVRLRYFWKDMTHDIAEFCKGCIMCQIFKTSTTGKTEVGTPRAVLRPNSCWQIDVCSGFPPVKGQTSCKRTNIFLEHC